MYTDGITEACNENREPFDTVRLLNAFSENIELDGKALARKVIDEAKAYSQIPAVDDMAIIIAKLI